MYPGQHARTHPDKPAVIAARSGETITYAELDARSNRLAQLLWAEGLRPGDHLALFLENHLSYFEVAWAALRSGLFLTTVNRYLTEAEAAYIVDDCGARVLISSLALRDVALGIPAKAPACKRCLMIDGPPEGHGAFDAYETAVAQHAAEPLEEELLGEFMLYSSGTTGRPKGISRPLPNRPVSGGLTLAAMLKALFHFDESSVYLSPAPLYHSAPIGFTTGVQSLGGTVVMMERFDALDALRALEQHAVTHSQWVPTMFSRMLKLPPEDRAHFDLTSHQVAVHAAAPCPRKVKQQMFEWWGPILYEYYGGTELNGLTYIGPEDWLAHPGSVGRAVMGTLHICDEEGTELPAGGAGIVYFERDGKVFEYHKDPKKTRSAQHVEHPTWTALGDVGHVDEDGFLYLTDRASFMIISGGVNIYPQEIENELILHPKVADVAVLGVPNSEFGEEVKAIVQPMPGVEADDAFAEEILAYARERLAAYKCPRSVDFESELPRLPTGKLYKRLLKDRYWENSDSKIV
ncbi:MAG: AMP-binding protein [Myxococcota bacterium]|nr:AMP-binding protein [Myxococcota bacterium]